ncbi:hypothetical protein [Afipia sp. DC4300-2b1]|uniref:hypothetical protein n=1 Tax=Afipia sp. DC4300-2b1 TaxID=2804672 RepID=UPI003CEF8F2D
MNKATSDYWADWLVDAVAAATQDRRYLRGDAEEDRAVTEAIFLNAKKAMENLLANHSVRAPS